MNEDITFKDQSGAFLTCFGGENTNEMLNIESKEERRTIEGYLTVSNSLVKFENIKFVGRVSISNSHVIFVNCEFQDVNKERPRINDKTIMIDVFAGSWAICQECTFTVRFKTDVIFEVSHSGSVLSCGDCSFKAENDFQTRFGMLVRDEGTVEVTRSKFENLQCGIYLYNNGKGNIMSCDFINNKRMLLILKRSLCYVNKCVSNCVNGIAVGESSLVVCNSDIQTKECGLDITNSKLEVNDSKISASLNGFIISRFSHVFIKNSEITSNGMFPSIFVSMSSAVVDSSVFLGNERTICVRDYGTFKATSCTFNGTTESQPKEIAVSDSSRCFLFNPTDADYHNIHAVLSNFGELYSDTLVTIEKRVIGGVFTLL
jgi:hypothetical protein